MRGADIVAQSLKKSGTKTIFALSGNQIMPIFDACIDAEITLYHVRHEAATTYMADCWAQLTGKVGVALVTAAPGFANALSPLYSARFAESPVVLLSGDSPIAADGSGAFKELDQTTDRFLNATHQAYFFQQFSLCSHPQYHRPPCKMHITLSVQVVFSCSRRKRLMQSLND